MISFVLTLIIKLLLRIPRRVSRKYKENEEERKSVLEMEEKSNNIKWCKRNFNLIIKKFKIEYKIDSKLIYPIKTVLKRNFIF